MTAEPGGLWVASHAFDFSATAGCDHDGENEDGGERMLKQDDRREMGTLERKARRKNDRMWVGRDLTSAVEGDGAQGHAWVGVWEFVAQAGEARQAVVLRRFAREHDHPLKGRPPAWPVYSPAFAAHVIDSAALVSHRHPHLPRRSASAGPSGPHHCRSSLG